MLALLEVVDVGVLEMRGSLFESPQSLFEASAGSSAVTRVS
jgi:hypothetical protein